ncbi:MAG: ArnT family glycosyltransferase, partial [Ilumatobacteraceae bacterium]
ALSNPIGFDGSMNLQVQQSLAEGNGYLRFYGMTTLFPIEVQTNGVPIVLGGLFIAVFGQHNLAYQATNVVFLVALGALIVALIRGRWRNALMLAVLFGTPMLFHLSLNGLGEFPLLVFELAAIASLSSVLARSSGRRAVCAAGLLVGLALTTKVVGVAVLLPLGVVLAIAWRRGLARPAAAGWWSAGVALPVVAWEGFRLYGLGSPGAWWAWWRSHTGEVAYQAGANDRAQQLAFIDGVWSRVSTLASGFDTGGWTLVVLGVVIFSVGGRELWRRRSSADVERWMVQCGLLAFSACYFAWWILVTPDEKARLRRVIIGIVVLLVLVAMLVADSETRRESTRPVLALAGLMLIAGTVVENARVVLAQDRQRLVQTEAAAEWVRGLSPSARLYGVGWWQAPAVSAYSQRGFYDLYDVDRCLLDPARDYFVIDEYSRTIAFKGQTTGEIEQFIDARLVDRFAPSESVEVGTVGPPSRCDAGG